MYPRELETVVIISYVQTFQRLGCLEQSLQLEVETVRCRLNCNDDTLDLCCRLGESDSKNGCVGISDCQSSGVLTALNMLIELAR